MAILESDIKLLKSERLTDYDDGGGHMTGNEVVDGQVNNLFPDISQLDRTYGRVSLRKAYPAILTDNTDTYYGAHAIVTDPPDDPNVNVTLFTTSDWADERADARNRVESYLAMGNESRYVLYGNHLEGQRAVLVYCRSSAPSPEVGEVYLLSQEKDGYTPYEQYVRITKLISRVETVIEHGANTACGTFTRDVITFEIANPLRYNFTASDVTCLTNHLSPTLVRTTVVADAAQYAGVLPLSQTANTGALALKVASIFGQLVPSTQMETPVLDAIAGAAQSAMVPSGAAGGITLSLSFNASVANTPYTFYFKGPVARNSVSITAPVALKDDGNGNIIAAGSDAGGFTGTIVYETGALTLTRTTTWNATLTATATPAGVVSENTFSTSVDITIQNRQYNYTVSLLPVPAPGAVAVDYRAQGKWVRLTDNGAGQLVGRDGEGTGTINYSTGSALLTVGALPDVGSAVIWTWAAPASYVNRAGDTNITPPKIEFTLSNAGVTPSSLTVSWLAGGVTKTATDNGAGAFTGDATGTIDYMSGETSLIPAVLPDSNTQITSAYTYGLVTSESPQLAINGAIASCTLGAPVKQKSLKLILLVSYQFLNFSVEIGDDGAGALITRRVSTNSGQIPAGDIYSQISGTINYATGLVSFTNSMTVIMRSWASLIGLDGNSYGGYWWSWSINLVFSAQTAAANYIASTDTPQSANVAVAISPIVIDFTPLVMDTVVPGSLRFTFAGETYVDRSGVLYKNISQTSNSGTASGAINYSTGKASLDNWTGGGSTALTVPSLLTRIGQWSAVSAHFRTPGSPLRPASLYVQANKIDGTLISATADMNGVLSGAEITGTVDVETGVVSLVFGKTVEDATLTAAQKLEWWYVAPIQPATTVWMPSPVVPSTITFNCVVYSNIPLDADLLGLDPVRLPMDGRVPVVKTGNVLVVHNTQTLTLPNPLTPGYVANVGRTRIAYAHVYDALGAKVLTDRFTTDLDAGTVTFADPLDLTGYTQPLKIEHRIEDMALCTDVQITGDIAISSQLTHDFAADTSYLSSALIIGDLQGRVANLFEQSTWTAVWSDVLIGSAPTSSYDDTNHPFVVTNKGAATERWAIIFTSASDFKCVGETFGQIALGNININFSPINPATGVPYFTIAATGWGSGWATGNVLRFNSIGANFPVWLARTTLQGAPTAFVDNFRLQIRGDAD